MNDVLKECKFNEEKERTRALNSTITIGLLVIYLIIIGFSMLTFSISNTKVLDVITIVTSALFIITNITFYKINKYSEKLHKVSVYCFLFTYILTFAVVGKEYMQYTILAILIVNILFYNQKEMRRHLIIAGLLNIVYLVRTYFILEGGGNKEDILIYQSNSIENTVIKTVFLFCLLYVVYRTTDRGKAFHGDITETLLEQQRIQANAITEIVATSNVIQDNTKISYTMVDELENSTKKVNRIIDQISESSEITVEHIQEQLMMTKTIQSSIENTVESSKDMVELANNSNESITKSLRILRRLKEQSDTIHSANRDVVDSLANLQENSQEVKSIADLIIGISNQTNLLALNASIESARAGEAGKGFAVVASEIGKLASDTKKAIGRILEISDNLHTNADISSNAVESTIKTTNQQETLIGKVLDSFHLISDNINNLSQDINHIDSMIDNLAVSNDSIVKNISNISSVTEEIAASSKEALQISKINQSAQKEVKEFLHEVEQTSKELERFNML